MKITEVRIKLMEDSDDRLQAFCSITFDDSFVVRDLKIIDGTNGPFVAMPSRKLTAHCPNCGCKNHLRAAHCNHCGLRIKDDLAQRDADGRVILYADIAHPINSACREMIQRRVIAEYYAELDRAAQPDYVSRYDDDYDWDDQDASERGSSELEALNGSGRAPSASRPEPVEHVAKRSPDTILDAQPAEALPRSPHQRPVSSATKRRGNEEFGQGIF